MTKSEPKPMSVAEETLRYVLGEMELSEEAINVVVVQIGIKRASILEEVPEDALEKAKGKNFKDCDIRMIGKFKRWCSWYRNHEGNGKLPKDWKETFNSDVFFDDFDDVQSSIKADDDEKSIVSKLSTTSMATNFEEENFCVKLSEFPKFSGKTHEWYTFRELFEATCKAAGFEEMLDMDDLEHQEKMLNNEEYQQQVKKFYKLLKTITASGTARGKIKKFEGKRDGVGAYAALKEYYDLDGDKRVYAQGQLHKIMLLELNYNSPGGFDKYLSLFEDLCERMVEAGEPLSESQKHTFFLNGIKDRDYDVIKDTCDDKDYNHTILELRKKAIKLNKAGGPGGGRQSGRRLNNKKRDNKSGNKSGKNKNRIDDATWKGMSPEVKQYITKLWEEIKSGTKKTNYGDQYENSQSTRQQNNTQQAAGDQKKDDHDDNKESSKKTVKFTLAGNLSGSKGRQQNVHW